VEAKEKIKEKLEIFLKHEEIGMTKDQYLRMVEQTGEEIDWDRCPPEGEDFPDSTITALNIFYSLGDRMYPEIGYVGKDFTNLNLFFDLYHIKHQAEKDWSTELILWLENTTIKKSQKALKSEMERLKRNK
jgi:hypothetical protein